MDRKRMRLEVNFPVPKSEIKSEEDVNCTGTDLLPGSSSVAAGPSTRFEDDRLKENCPVPKSEIKSEEEVNCTGTDLLPVSSSLAAGPSTRFEDDRLKENCPVPKSEIKSEEEVNGTSTVLLHGPSSLAAGPSKKFEEDILEEEFQESDWDEDLDSDWGGISNENDEEDEEGRVIIVPHCNLTTSEALSQIPEPSSRIQFLDGIGSSPQPPTWIPFLGNTGLKMKLESNDPIDYFFLLFTNNFFDLILNATNHQADILSSNNMSPKARIRGWKKLSRPEFEIFLGLLYLSSHVTSPSFSHYWQHNQLYDFPIFRNAISRDRFLIILRALNFAISPQQEEPKSTEPLDKIKPLIDLFNSTMYYIYYPSKELNLDESILLRQGCLYLRQYMLTQPNGLVLKMKIYSGSSVKEAGGRGHAGKVVKHLLSNYLGAGHSVFMDNYYSSLDITNYLLDENTYSTGTLKANRKGNPLKVVNKKLKQGEVEAVYSNEGVCIMKWRDKKDIIVISSEFGAELKDNKSGPGKKPESLIKYNENKGGVNKSDQLLSYYSCQRKTLRWYTKVGIHLFNVIMNNSYLLHKTFSDNNKLSLLEFRDSVISALIYNNRPILGRKIENPAAKTYHTPKEVPRNEKNRKIRKRCIVCKQVGKRVESSYYCNNCPDNPGLCLHICFAKFHGYKEA